ncbi:ABC transporter ATP-binding protein [Nocardiopsis chromatogenes]|uniref:ABC transporter ATP-binding protein n=1 Tax=Nocardiopsis chromatogenes TaxID=280239 RepID=UPI00036A947E|nr:ATP-binding cassette domain-containing protein [Nocardiopsis chromatogenes]
MPSSPSSDSSAASDSPPSSPADGPVIDARGLGRSFTVSEGPLLRRRRRTVDAVDGVTFQVRPGEVVGYLGPNGAGKSTTMKMLIGLLTPGRGRLRVLGLEPARHRARLAARIGIVFGQRTTLWWDLPLRDSLALTRHLYRVAPHDHARRLAELTELLELGPFLHTPVRQLSLGQRMRGDLTAALLHDPDLLVLDEPTIGLDVVSKSTIRAFLTRLNSERGTTILLTTHDLGDVERLCRRVVVIDHGRLAYDGDLAGLRDRAPGPRTLVVDLAEPGPPIAVPGARCVRRRGPRQWLELDGNPAEVIAQVARDRQVADLTVQEPGIEGVVARLYQGDAALAAADGGE